MSKEKDTDKSNFYLSGRQEWLERYGSYIKQAKNWRLMAFGSLAISFVFAIGIVYEADRVHNVPYVFEVNKLGQQVELGKAVESGSFNEPVIRHVVSRFVWLLYTKNPSKSTQKSFISESFDYVSSKAGDALDHFYLQHHPYEAYEKGTFGTSVHITSAETIGDVTNTKGSYIVDFSVKTYNKHGALIKTQDYQGTINYKVITPSQNPNILEGNPFGIYITSFSFSKEI